MKKRASGSIFLSTDKDTVVYRLVASRTSVNIRRVNGSLVPDVGTISFAVTKQSGDEAPATMAAKDWNMEGVTVGITYLAGDTMPHLYGGEDIEVKAEYKGVTAVISRGGTNIDTCTVGFIIDGADGVQGSRGPTLRGPQLWEDCPERFQFENGSEGTEFLDIVMHGSRFWYCNQSHRKTPENYPSASSAYWRAATELNFVATRILLAEYALIKNLGVESLEMYARDAEGEIIKNADGTNKVIAYIKDGVIRINTGVFKDVTVSGTLDGVSGSFKELLCKDTDGRTVGKIAFSADGVMTFEGDLYHQGAVNGRAAKFYTSQMICRGSFGAQQRSVVVVDGGTATYYVDGVESEGTAISIGLKQKTSSDGKKYYDVYTRCDTTQMADDGVSLTTDQRTRLAGFAAELIVMSPTSTATAYYYNMVMAQCQKSVIINVNDRAPYVNVGIDGNWVNIPGGGLREIICMRGFKKSAKSKDVPGYDVMLGAVHDNSWT